MTSYIIVAWSPCTAEATERIMQPPKSLHQVIIRQLLIMEAGNQGESLVAFPTHTSYCVIMDEKCEYGGLLKVEGQCDFK